MLRKIGRYLGYALMWVAVFFVWRWADSGRKEYRASQRVEECNIVVEGNAERQLVDARLMQEWFELHGVSPVGRTLSELDLAVLERTALSHSAVESVNAFVTHDGRVTVNITQREPMVRLRVDGYDMYITEDGYIFPASDGYAVLVPVITGGYKPIFAADYSGYIRDMVRDSVATIERAIADVEQQKVPHYILLRQYDKELRSVLNSRVRREMFMSDYEVAKRKEELEQRKIEAQRENEERHDRINADIAILDRQQERLREQRRYVEGVGSDFDNLMDFVHRVDADRFWSAEVVQILVEGGGTVPMQLSFVPRSASFLVDMGYAEAMGDKLASLHRFYQKALPNVGWEKYSTISLRYDGQVVCR